MIVKVIIVNMRDNAEETKRKYIHLVSRIAPVTAFQLTFHSKIAIDFHILNFTALSVRIRDDVLKCTTYSDSSL